jgi:toxin ParE1/3/4
MRIVWSPESRDDLLDIWTYIADDSVRSADQVQDRIIDAVAALAEYPERGRPGRRAGTRELVVPHTSHLVIYRLVDEYIEIVRLWHMSRRPFR